MNAELDKSGYHTIVGRVGRKFFYEHFYGNKALSGKRNGERMQRNGCEED